MRLKDRRPLYCSNEWLNIKLICLSKSLVRLHFNWMQCVCCMISNECIGRSNGCAFVRWTNWYAHNGGYRCEEQTFCHLKWRTLSQQESSDFRCFSLCTELRPTQFRFTKIMAWNVINNSIWWKKLTLVFEIFLLHCWKALLKNIDFRIIGGLRKDFVAKKYCFRASVFSCFFLCLIVVALMMIISHCHCRNYMWMICEFMLRCQAISFALVTFSNPTNGSLARPSFDRCGKSYCMQFHLSQHKKFNPHFTFWKTIHIACQWDK